MMVQDDQQRNAWAALEDLLQRLFGASELRRWVEREYGEDLANALVGEKASVVELAHEVVTKLKARGLIDAHFFQRLLVARGHRRAEIDHVRSMCGVEAGMPEDLGRVAARGSFLPASDWSRAGRVSRSSALFCCSVLLLTRCYPKLDLSSSVLRPVEERVFSFLPIGYRHLGLAGLTAVCVLLAVAFWLMNTRRNR